MKAAIYDEAAAAHELAELARPLGRVVMQP